MSDERGSGASGIILSFLLGGLTGAALAILFAPRPGKETRDILEGKFREGAEKGRELKEKAVTRGREILDEANQYVEKQREGLEKRKDRLSAAIEAGRQAYREEKEKMEGPAPAGARRRRERIEGEAMDSVGWGVVFLGIIALSSLVQAAFLIGLARASRRLAQRVEEIQERIERDVKPTLDHLSRTTRNLAEVSDLAVLQARRVDDLLADTAEKIEDVTSALRRVILRPLGPLVDVVAFLKGVRRGLEVYRKLGGFEAQGRGSARHYADDEHLFI